jgi:hypothetical protein
MVKCSSTFPVDSIMRGGTWVLPRRSPALWANRPPCPPIARRAGLLRRGGVPMVHRPGYASLTPRLRIRRALQLACFAGEPCVLPVNNLVGLARISHHPSTAAADLRAVAGRTPSSRLDVVSATPAPSSTACAPPQRHLDPLATNGGEICGPGRRPEQVVILRAIHYLCWSFLQERGRFVTTAATPR